jgi:hypothetical protein
MPDYTVTLHGQTFHMIGGHPPTEADAQQAYDQAFGTHDAPPPPRDELPGQIPIGGVGGVPYMQVPVPKAVENVALHAAPGIYAAMLPGVGGPAEMAAWRALATGVGETAISAAEGHTAQDVAKRGLISGGLSLASDVAMPYITNAITSRLPVAAQKIWTKAVGADPNIVQQMPAAAQGGPGATAAAQRQMYDTAQQQGAGIITKGNAATARGALTDLDTRIAAANAPIPKDAAAQALLDEAAKGSQDPAALNAAWDSLHAIPSHEIPAATARDIAVGISARGGPSNPVLAAAGSAQDMAEAQAARAAMEPTTRAVEAAAARPPNTVKLGAAGLALLHGHPQLAAALAASAHPTIATMGGQALQQVGPYVPGMSQGMSALVRGTILNMLDQQNWGR